MKCIDKQFIAVHSEDPVRFFNFERFESIPTKTDYVLIPGGQNWNFFDTYPKDNVVVLHFEEPNCFSVGSALSVYEKHKSKIFKVYSICPYSTKYYNAIENSNRHEVIWLPFNLQCLPAVQPKIFDVFYSGHHMSCPFDQSYLHAFEKRCIVAFDGGTHRGVSYTEKLKLNAQSKISVVHNKLRPASHGLALEYPSHEGLALCGSEGLPQLKFRCIEAAASKSLMLCLHDHWNLIERQFTPGVDFLYWYNAKDLKEKVAHILANYETYTPMIESAYAKVTTLWTTEKFFDAFLRNI